MDLKCLRCYGPLLRGETGFHPRCARQVFGASKPPALAFSLEDLKPLAQDFVLQREAVTGVQPKLSLHLEPDSRQFSRLTVLGLYGDFILKPPAADYEALPENEDLTMHLARLSGIETASHTLIQLASGELAYLTRRFDRKSSGEKVAVEDFCQLTENLTEHKYRGSVELLGKTVRRFCAHTGLESLRLFELVLFCFLTGNADMHLKNFSLIQTERGDYSLSPAYDLVCTKLALPKDLEESALTINGKKTKLRQSDFEAFADNLQIPTVAAQNSLKRFSKMLPKWHGLVEKSFLPTPLQETYKGIICQRAAALNMEFKDGL